jgi:hypothetical protein
MAVAHIQQVWGNETLNSLGQALWQVALDDSARGPCRRVVAFCAARWDVPLTFLVAYLSMIWLAARRRPAASSSGGGPRVDRAFAAWNLGLSLFSCWGIWQHATHLSKAVASDGFLNTVCNDPFSFKTDDSQHPTLALFLFAFSKIPELGDTVFLILKGKRVRFLQWYHHSTVMLFCWLAIATEYTPGIWFAATNYAVHAIMYMYFFLMAFDAFKSVVKAIAPLVTVIQIAQMVFGLFINGYAVWSYVVGRYCHIQDVAVYSAVVMYGSYFVLFSQLFVESKSRPKSRGARSEKLATEVFSQDMKPAASVRLEHSCNLDRLTLAGA